MCAWVDDRVFVGVHEQDAVSCVVELLDQCLDAVAQFCRMLVLTRVEEEVKVVWDAAQVHRLPAFDAELREFGEAVG